jgi:hypothetical protein
MPIRPRIQPITASAMNAAAALLIWLPTDGMANTSRLSVARGKKGRPTAAEWLVTEWMSLTERRILERRERGAAFMSHGDESWGLQGRTYIGIELQASSLYNFTKH